MFKAKDKISWNSYNNCRRDLFALNAVGIQRRRRETKSRTTMINLDQINHSFRILQLNIHVVLALHIPGPGAGSNHTPFLPPSPFFPPYIQHIFLRSTNQISYQNCLSFWRNV